MNWRQEPLYRNRRREWVEALRSGKYKQGRNRLRTIDSFCCLGVGCDISRLGEWGHRIFGEAYFVGNLASNEAFPPTVRDFFGLPDLDPAMANSEASELNDRYELTFNDIAMCIELEELAQQEEGVNQP